MIWYPYEQMKTMKSPIKIKEANGVYLYTEDGKKLIDSVSSWWSVIHGYNNVLCYFLNCKNCNFKKAQSYP